MTVHLWAEMMVDWLENLMDEVRVVPMAAQWVARLDTLMVSKSVVHSEYLTVAQLVSRRVD